MNENEYEFPTNEAAYFESVAEDIREWLRLSKEEADG